MRREREGGREREKIRGSRRQGRAWADKRTSSSLSAPWRQRFWQAATIQPPPHARPTAARTSVRLPASRPRPTTHTRANLAEEPLATARRFAVRHRCPSSKDGAEFFLDVNQQKKKNTQTANSTNTFRQIKSFRRRFLADFWTVGNMIRGKLDLFTAETSVVKKHGYRVIYKIVIFLCKL